MTENTETCTELREKKSRSSKHSGATHTLPTTLLYLNIFSDTLRCFAKSLCVFHSRYPPPAQDTVKQMQSPLLNANSIFSRSLVERREICQ